MWIDGQNFHKFDLNSLVTFMMVYQERGVSKAAKSLNVTQPAVSNVLCKLRKRFEDPLFIPCGREVLPTSKAELIAQILAPAMLVVQSVLTEGTGDELLDTSSDAVTDEGE